MIWYLVTRRGVGAPSDAHLRDHLRWLRRQHRDGRVLFSGPSADRTLGLYVVRAASLADARSVAVEDPLAGGDQATVEVIEWHVHQILGIGPFDPDSLDRAVVAEQHP